MTPSEFKDLLIKSGFKADEFTPNTYTIPTNNALVTIVIKLLSGGFNLVYRVRAGFTGALTNHYGASYENGKAAIKAIIDTQKQIIDYERS